MKVEMFKVEMLIITQDIENEEDLIDVIEGTRYPNHCISPDVIKVIHKTVEWDDDHPLNNYDTQTEAYNELFKESK